MSSKAQKFKAAAARAGTAATSIEDRLAHAREMAGLNPLRDEKNDTSAQAPGALASSIARTAPAPQIAHQNDVAENGLKYRVIEVDQIHPNPFNARQVYHPERVSELAASIGAHGQETPGLATMRDGKVILAAGHYRLRALKVANVKTMMLMMRDDISDKELYEISYRENAQREDQTCIDNALAWKQLLTERVYVNETEIAEATGLSLSSVNKTMSALKLSSEALAAVKEDPSAFGISVLYEIVLFEAAAVASQSLNREEAIIATLDIVRAVRAEEMSRIAIHAAREKLAKPSAPRKQREQSRQYEIQHAGSAIGQLKEWDSGKVVLEVTYANPEEREAIVNELKARFGLNKG